jgi:hypothetical protein
MTLRHRAFSPQLAARIAGAAYLITNATAEFNLFFVRPRIFVAGDAARTASNIMAHAQLYRLAIIMDLLTVAGVVVLNVALYELLAPVHRSLARLAAFWRLVESSIYGAIIVCNFVILSVLSGDDYRQAFEPRQLQALVRLLMSAKTAGFWIAMLFLGLGSAIYCCLLVKSRYVPKALALSGVAACVLFVPAIFVYFLFPEFFAAGAANLLALPVSALVLLGLILVPIFSFEFTIGFWLLLKGVRVAEADHIEHKIPQTRRRE